MLDHFDLLRGTHNSILNFYYCGSQQCKPGHSYGPALRDHFLIHYIHSGKGTFTANGKTYPLEKGQGFLICPGEVVSYSADFEDPWHYSWVAFKGSMVEQYLCCANLTGDNPVFQCKQSSPMEECLGQLLEAKKRIHTVGGEVRLLGLTYHLLSLLMDEAGSGSFQYEANHRANYYIEKAMDFIYKNYWRRFSISELAAHVKLERKYLCSIFKKELNSTPQQMLINFRIRKACELLADNSLSIAQIALSVGYDDSVQFSKMFKKVTGSSPTAFREKRVLLI